MFAWSSRCRSHSSYNWPLDVPNDTVHTHTNTQVTLSLVNCNLVVGMPQQCRIVDQTKTGFTDIRWETQVANLLASTATRTCGPGSSVGIATSYGLDGPGIESRWGARYFRTCADRPWGPPSLLYNGYRVFPGGKERLERDTDPSTLLVLW